MTRTGTRRGGREYSYYSCGGSQQKGKSVCRGRHVPMARLDALIVDNVKEHLFGGARLARVLDALVERQCAKDQAVEVRRTAVEAEIASRDDRLKRLYRAIEEGIVDLDGDLKQRIQALKQEREVAQAALDRLSHSGPHQGGHHARPAGGLFETHVRETRHRRCSGAQGLSAVGDCPDRSWRRKDQSIQRQDRACCGGYLRECQRSKCSRFCTRLADPAEA